MCGRLGGCTGAQAHVGVRKRVQHLLGGWLRAAVYTGRVLSDGGWDVDWKINEQKYISIDTWYHTRVSFEISTGTTYR